MSLNDSRAHYSLRCFLCSKNVTISTSFPGVYDTSFCEIVSLPLAQHSGLLDEAPLELLTNYIGRNAYDKGSWFCHDCKLMVKSFCEEYDKLLKLKENVNWELCRIAGVIAHQTGLTSSDDGDQGLNCRNSLSAETATDDNQRPEAQPILDGINGLDANRSKGRTKCDNQQWSCNEAGNEGLKCVIIYAVSTVADNPAGKSTSKAKCNSSRLILQKLPEAQEQPIAMRLTAPEQDSSSRNKTHEQDYNGKDETEQDCNEDGKNHVTLPSTSTVTGNGSKGDLTVSSTLVGESSAKPFKRDKCLQQFTRKVNLKRHKGRRDHSNEKSTGQQRPRPKTEKTKSLQCVFCCKKLFKCSHLTSHMYTHTREKPFSCKYCGREFSGIGDCRKHICRLHSMKKFHTCETCEKGFVTQGDLRRHLTVHTGETPHLCVFCKRMFATRSNLTRHLKLHIREWLYDCRICGRTFSHRYRYRRHICKPHDGHHFLCKEN